MRELIRHILKEEPQLDEIDKKLFNFLIRRLKVEERNLSGYWEDFKPIKIKEYSFEGVPGYGFTDYYSKKEMEKTIIDMFWENDVIDFYPYELDERDPKRIKIIKTIRRFLNHTL